MEHLIRGTRMAMGLDPVPPRKDLFSCIYCGRIYKTRKGWIRHMVTKKGKLRRNCP